MTSYQNTSEFHPSMSAMNNYGDPNFYYNQSPTNFQIHQFVYEPESYRKQETYPTLTPDYTMYEPAPIIYENSHFHENASDPQQNLIQYTPLTPEPVPYPVFYLQPTQPHHNNNYMAKRHHAQIKILPSSRGNFKAVVKRKRKRTVFTTEQVEALEDIFKTKQYITREERTAIVDSLNIHDKAVKIWFQNRRLKIKRMPEQCAEEQEDSSSIRHSVKKRRSPEIARLDVVESEISNKTDEFGFVTLDDGVMGDLVNVIDDFLTKSNLDAPAEEIAKSDSTPLYEPISPASISDSNEEDNSSCWRPSEPNESLQRLFDLQTMLSL